MLFQSLGVNSAATIIDGTKVSATITPLAQFYSFSDQAGTAAAG